MRVWVHFMQDTVKERLSLCWHDWVNPMWWHPPPPLWGWVSLQCLHLCLPFILWKSPRPCCFTWEMLCPLYIFNLRILFMHREEERFFPQDELSGGLVFVCFCFFCFFCVFPYSIIKKCVHYVSVWFVSLSGWSAAWQPTLRLTKRFSQIVQERNSGNREIIWKPCPRLLDIRIWKD